MNNLQGLFNPASVVEAPTTRNGDEYKVSFKEGKGGVYESVVRFVPFFANPEKSIMQKQVDYVKNPVTQKGMYVDDPRTVGQFSPVLDMFFKLYNSGNAAFKEFGKNHLSNKAQYASLVQIIKDDQHPELVGKIKVFKYGKKVWDKLYNEEHPAMGQGKNPFQPVSGRYFYIKCVSSAGFNNFDQSYFFDNVGQNNQVLASGLWFTNSTTGQVEVVTENSDQQMVFDYLATNSPDLSKYDYTPWTSEQQAFVDETLALIAGYMQSGTLQTNLATLNTPSAPTAGIQMTATPVFPGATPVANSTAPIMSTPMTPSASPAVPVMPTPTPAVAATPSPNMGAVVMGQPSLGGSPVIPGTPSITGIDLPIVEPVNVAAPGVTPSIGGNIDDVISML